MSASTSDHFRDTLASVFKLARLPVAVIDVTGRGFTVSCATQAQAQHVADVLRSASFTVSRVGEASGSWRVWAR